MAFGIRHEDLRIDQSGAAAKLVVVEPAGAETFLAVDFGGEHITCILREPGSFRAGDTVNLAFDSPAAHFFELETGQRR